MPDQTGPLDGTGGRGGRTGDGAPRTPGPPGTPESSGQPSAHRAPGPAAPSAAWARGDFFDRLLARYAPSGGRADEGLVRVRPRLPEPFERIESLGVADDAASEAAAGPWSTSPQVAPSPQDAGRALREIRTERERTVLHTERTPEPEDTAPRWPAPLTAEPAALRPATTPLPRRPWATEAGARRAGRGDGPSADPAGGTAVGRLVPEAGTAPPAGAGALRPASAADAQAAARGAARAAAARRAARGAEHVVHVQIGRLEVSAAGPAARPGRPERAPARRPPTVGLEDFLRRGRDGDRAG